MSTMFGPSVARRGAFLTQRVPWVSPTLSGSWVNFDASETTYFKGGYCLNEFAHVFLRGRVMSGTGTIFTLPEEFRPLKRVSVVTAADSGIARIDVLATGEVAVQSYLAGGTNAWVSLDGIGFEIR